MYLGRFFQGQQVPLTLSVTDQNGTPQLPAAAPTARVRGDAGAVLQTMTLPILDRYGATGLFQTLLTLGNSFPAGRYRVSYHWTSGSYTGETEDVFEVAPGGDPAGAVISMCWYERPHANFLVLQMDPASGQLLFGRNPSL
jgi:hypothetical protein